MNELAVQSANGTNAKVDRQAIQDEINQLATEIDRVSETTKFNETYLLNGDAAKGTKDVYTYKVATTPEKVAYATGKAFGDFFGEGKTAAYATEDELKADLKAGKKIYTDAAVTTNQDVADKAVAADYTITNAAATGVAITAGTVSNTPVLNELAKYTPGTDTLTFTWSDAAASNAGAYTYTDENGEPAEISKAGLQTLSGVTTIAAANDGDTLTVKGPSVTHAGDLYKQGETTRLSDSDIIKTAEAGTDMYTTAATVTQTEAAADDAVYTPAKEEMAQLYDKDGKEVDAADIAEMVKKGDKLGADSGTNNKISVTTSSPRQDSPCWLRQTSPHRAFFPYYSKTNFRQCTAGRGNNFPCPSLS